MKMIHGAGMGKGASALRLTTRFTSVVLLAILATPSAVLSQTSARPNIIFIAIDDLNTAVGYLSEQEGNLLKTIYPDPETRARVREVLTPSIDRLAKSGVAFSRAYAPSTVCNPSRTALLTGVPAHVSGIYDKEDGHFRDLGAPWVNEIVSLPQNFKEHGYFTVGLGKIFHQPDIELNADGALVRDFPDSRYSWSRWINRPTGTNGKGTESRWSPKLSGGRLSFGSRSKPAAAQFDFQNADFLARLLEEGRATIQDIVYKTQRTVQLPSNKPFFMAVGLARPHLPWSVPDELLQLFNANDILITRETLKHVLEDVQDLSRSGKIKVGVGGDGQVNVGEMAELLDHGLSIDPNTGDITAWKEAVRHYLASIALADRCVERILTALENSSHRSNTIVVMWSDHGLHLGEKHSFLKQTLWEESTQVPLIIRSPNQNHPGIFRNAPVSLMDLYRTLSAMANLTVPDYVAGYDISAMLKNPGASRPDPPLITFRKGNHALRTVNSSYIRFRDQVNDAELYDMTSDPDQFFNRVSDPALKSVRSELNSKLNVLLTRDHLPGKTALDAEEEIPDSYLRLGSIAPNPTPGSTRITYDVDRPANIHAVIYDVLGRQIRRIVVDAHSAGTHEIRWDGLDSRGRTASSGLYLLRLEARSAGVAVTIGSTIVVAR